MTSVTDKGLYYIKVEGKGDFYVLSENGDISKYSSDFTSVCGHRTYSVSFPLFDRSVTIVSPIYKDFFGRESLLLRPVMKDGSLMRFNDFYSSVNDICMMCNVLEAMGYNPFVEKGYKCFMIRGHVRIPIYKYSYACYIYMNIPIDKMIKWHGYMNIPKEIRSELYGVPSRIDFIPCFSRKIYKNDGIAYENKGRIFVKIYHEKEGCFFHYRASDFILAMIENKKIHYTAIFNIMSLVASKLKRSGRVFRKKHFKELDSMLRYKKCEMPFISSEQSDELLYIEMANCLSETLKHKVTI